MTKGKLISLTLLTLLFYSCGVSEYFDVDEVEVRGTAEPSWILPALTADLELKDILEERPDTIEYVDDGSGRKIVQIVYRDEDLATFKATEMYDTPDIPGVNETFEMGVIEIPERKESIRKNLKQLIDQIKNGTIKDFVEIAINSPTILGFDAGDDLGDADIKKFDHFEEAEFEEGLVQVTMKNDMQMPIDIKLELWDEGLNKQVGDPLEFSLKTKGAANDEETKEVSLKGERISNDLKGKIVGFSSSGGGSGPLDPDNNSFLMTVKVSKSKINGGRAKLPETELDPVSVDGKFGDTDMELKSVTFKSGKAILNVESNVRLVLDTKIEFPAIKSFPVQERTLDFTVKKQQQIVLDFAGYEADLTLGGTTSNSFPVMITPILRESKDFVKFTSTSKFDVTAKFENLELEGISGYFGQETFTVDSETFDIEEEIMDQLEGRIILHDPKFKLKVKNKGIGLPFRLDVKLQRPKDGIVVNKTIDLESAKDMTTPHYQDIVIDKSTDNFIELLTLPFDQIEYAASGQMNPEGKNGPDQFVAADAEVHIGAEVELPLHITLDGLALQDTIEADLTGEDIAEDIDKVFLLLDVKNGFPMGAQLTFDFWGSNRWLFKVDPKTNGDYDIEAAPVVDGVVPIGEVKESNIEIELTPDQISNLKNVKEIIVRAEMQTTDNDEVKIYTDYKIGVVVRIRASASLDISEYTD